MTVPGLPELDFSGIGPGIGESFPDLRLPNQAGEPVSVHEYRDGHKLLFVVYRSADW